MFAPQMTDSSRSRFSPSDESDAEQEDSHDLPSSPFLSPEDHHQGLHPVRSRQLLLMKPHVPWAFQHSSDIGSESEEDTEEKSEESDVDGTSTDENTLVVHLHAAPNLLKESGNIKPLSDLPQENPAFSMQEMSENTSDKNKAVTNLVFPASDFETPPRARCPQQESPKRIPSHKESPSLVHQEDFSSRSSSKVEDSHEPLPLPHIPMATPVQHPRLHNLNKTNLLISLVQEFQEKRKERHSLLPNQGGLVQNGLLTRQTAGDAPEALNAPPSQNLQVPFHSLYKSNYASNIIKPSNLGSDSVSEFTPLGPSNPHRPTQPPLQQPQLQKPVFTLPPLPSGATPFSSNAGPLPFLYLRPAPSFSSSTNSEDGHRKHPSSSSENDEEERLANYHLSPRPAWATGLTNLKEGSQMSPRSRQGPLNMTQQSPSHDWLPVPHVPSPSSKHPVPRTLNFTSAEGCHSLYTPSPPTSSSDPRVLKQRVLFPSSPLTSTTPSTLSSNLITEGFLRAGGNGRMHSSDSEVPTRNSPYSNHKQINVPYPQQHFNAATTNHNSNNSHAPLQFFSPPIIASSSALTIDPQLLQPVRGLVPVDFLGVGPTHPQTQPPPNPSLPAFPSHSSRAVPTVDNLRRGHTVPIPHHALVQASSGSPQPQTTTLEEGEVRPMDAGEASKELLVGIDNASVRTDSNNIVTESLNLTTQRIGKNDGSNAEEFEGEEDEEDEEEAEAERHSLNLGLHVLRHHGEGALGCSLDQQGHNINHQHLMTSPPETPSSPDVASDSSPHSTPCKHPLGARAYHHTDYLGMWAPKGRRASRSKRKLLEAAMAGEEDGSVTTYCPNCGKTYRQNNSLFKHLYEHHPYWNKVSHVYQLSKHQQVMLMQCAEMLLSFKFPDVYGHHPYVRF